MDALGLVGQMLDKMVKGIAPDNTIKLTGEARREELCRLRDESWRGAYARAAKAADNKNPEAPAVRREAEEDWGRRS